MTKKPMLICLLGIFTGCSPSNHESGAVASSSMTPDRPAPSETTDAAATASEHEIIPVRYDAVEIAKAKLNPVRTDDIKHTLSDTSVQNGSVLLYSKKDGENDLFAGIQTSTKNLEVEGLVGYGDPPSVTVSELDLNGIHLIKIEGSVDAFAPLTHYLFIENDEPQSFWQTESRVIEQNVDGDGTTELIAAAGGTIPDTTIYKLRSPSQLEAVNLNKLMNGSVIWFQNNQFDVYYGLNKKAEHYRLTNKGMEFTGIID